MLIPILLIAGLGYFRYAATRQNLTNPQSADNQESNQAPVEVPKTLPGATLEDRVKSIEDVVAKLVPQVNNLKSSVAKTSPSNSSESRLADLESAVAELKDRVSVLEKATPAPATVGSKYPLYITMGAGGGPWNSLDWVTTTEYQVPINSGDYSGYSGMQLEVNFRLNEPNGTASVRLYNLTDGSSISSQVDTASTSFAVQTSTTFKLPSGTKTYTLQAKSSEGKNVFIQSARIKVNF